MSTVLIKRAAPKQVDWKQHNETIPSVISLLDRIEAEVRLYAGMVMTDLACSAYHLVCSVVLWGVTSRRLVHTTSSINALRHKAFEFRLKELTNQQKKIFFFLSKTPVYHHLFKKIAIQRALRGLSSKCKSRKEMQVASNTFFQGGFSSNGNNQIA